MDPSLSVDEVMTEVRTRVRDRIRAELARTRPGSPLVDEDIFAETEALLRRALDQRAHLVTPNLLLDADEWDLATSLRWGSHRRRTGGVVTWVKRRVLLPLTRWLYEFSRDNFERQARVNDTLMAAIEALAVELVVLRRELAARTGQPASVPPEPPRPPAP